MESWVSSTLTCIAEANGAKVVSNRQLAKHLLAYVQEFIKIVCSQASIEANGEEFGNVKIIRLSDEHIHSALISLGLESYCGKAASPTKPKKRKRALTNEESRILAEEQEQILGAAAKKLG